MYSNIDTIKQLKEREKILLNKKIKIYNFIIKKINSRIIKKLDSSDYYIALKEMDINISKGKLIFNFIINDPSGKINYSSIKFNILTFNNDINYNIKINKFITKNKKFNKITKINNKIVEKFLKFITKENMLNNINNELKNIEENLEKIKSENTKIINQIFNLKNQINNSLDLKI